MPIYEFKCLKCDEHMEILILGSEDKQVGMQCSKCGSEDLERIMSSTHFSVAAGGGKAAPATQTRSCSSGSCTTWNLPGHTR